jgi:hypothetical protein
LKKIDEQKQLREQIQKRKLQSREQRNRPPKTTGADQKRPSSSSSAKPEQEKEGKMPKSLDDLKQKRPRIESQKSSSTDAKEQDLGKSNKLKPYLAVVVTNVKDLQNAYKRLSRDITSLGPTKVVLTFSYGLLF